MHLNVNSVDTIDKCQLSIRLNEGLGWHTTLYPLFDKGVMHEIFPKSEGIYTLIISYRNLFYQEIVLYRMKPELEQLEFNFFEEHEKIFCKIKSDYAYELNKTVILNEIDEELRKVVDYLSKTINPI